MDTQNNTAIATPGVLLSVKILAWLLLLEGIMYFMGSGIAGFLLVTSGQGIFGFLAILILLSAVRNIVVFFGLRKMKKWALYLFAFFTAFSVIVSVILYTYIYFSATDPITNYKGLTSLLVDVSLSVYFLALRKKFN